MSKYYYLVTDYDDDINEAFPIDSSFHEGWEECLAKECAEDFWDHHDGWESNWPMTFKLFDANKNELGTYIVDMEAEPTFSAKKMEVD
jgi:hypothetical protein